MSESLKEDGTDSASDSDDNQDQDSTPERLSPVDNPPLEEHKLQYPYWLWYRHSTPQDQNNTLQNYEQSLMLVGECSTVEQWWGMYSHLKRTDELPPDTSFHLFKVGIRPMWEDSANINGGKWEVRIRRGLGSWAWEEICMAMLGEQFDIGDEICGAVINIKLYEVLVAIWHRTATDQAASACIQDTIRQVLNLPPWILLEYKRHSKSLSIKTQKESRSSQSERNVS